MRALLLASAALLGMAAAAAPARAFVYWANYGSDSSGSTIGRANLDGTAANQSFVTGARGPVGVAVDEAFVYWANSDSRSCSGTTIGRARLDGTGASQSFISGANCAHEIEPRGSKIYWANRGPNGTGTSVGRANRDGTGVEVNFIPGGSGPWGVAVDDAHVYWTNRGTAGASPCGGSIGRANLDGTGIDQRFIAAGVDGPTGIAVDGGHLYWANGCGTTIGRAKLDGSGVESSFVPASQPAGVAIDGTYIYWANFANPTATGGGTTIGRARLDGTGANQSFITGASSPTGLAVDGLGAPPPDRVAPRVTALRVSPRSFASGRFPASAAAASRGTTISYSSTEAGVARLSFAAVRSGRRKGKRCVAPSARRRRARRCTRLLPVTGAITLPARAGANRIRFSGRVNAGTLLAPGSYRLTLVVTDAAGNRSKPARSGFAVKPPANQRNR